MSIPSLRTKIERQIQRLLRGYTNGIYTWKEIVAQLGGLALSPSFFECVPSLSGEIVSELRRIALHAPSHPEDVLIIHSYCGPLQTEEYEKVLEQERIRCYWSARKLRDFFYPDLQFPPFEVIKLVGTVEECVRIDNSVVLFGEFQEWLIRNHSVHCVAPNGQIVPVTVVNLGKTKHNHENSPDSLVRKYGRPSISLDATDLRTEQVPAGSKVWVDRTEAMSMPDVDEGELT